MQCSTKHADINTAINTWIRVLSLLMMLFYTVQGHSVVRVEHITNYRFLICFCLRASFGLKKPSKMNMVKRIMGRPRQDECSPQDNALGLMHLRRLFSELCHPPRHMTQKEQEEKLYMMLPVFNRVSEKCGISNKMTPKYSSTVTSA